MESEQEFKLKSLFIPFTTLKAVHYIVFIGLIVFCNVLFNGFVWDDIPFIIENPQIHQFDIIQLFGANLFNSGSFYRPIPAVYFAGMYALFGPNAFFFHLMQIILHITASCLVFLFFKKFFNNLVSFFLAIVFLVHPINVESVAYIGATQSELFFISGISALLLAGNKSIGLKKYILITVLLLLSVFTKETGFLFFLILLLYRYITTKQISIPISIIVAGISCIYFICRYFIGKVTLVDIPYIPIAGLPFTERLLNIPAIMLYYLKTFIYPVNLAVWQDWTITSVKDNKFIIPAIIIIALLLVRILLQKKLRKDNKAGKYLTLFSIWYLLGMSLLVQVIPLDMTVADRWFYFPFVGILGILGIFLQKLFTKNKIVFIVVLAIVVSLLSIRSIIRNTNYKDEITLYTHDIQIENNANIQMNLGAAYLREEKVDDGIANLNKSISFYPSSNAYYNLALAYEYKGDKSKAEEYYKDALALPSIASDHKRHDIRIYESYAQFLLGRSDYLHAKQITQTGLGYYPISQKLIVYMALSEYKLRNYESAVTYIEKAKNNSQDPETIDLYNKITSKQDIPINVNFTQ